MGNFSGKGLVFRAVRGADLIELHSLLCLSSPCDWAPVHLPDIILLLGPS